MGRVSIFIFLSLLSCLSPSYGFDPLDPKGNITIKWDLLQSNSDSYNVRVSMFNFQLFRHIEQPGWKMSWTWQNNEVIWKILGAEATEQGNCSRFTGQSQLPHSCKKQPYIVDLMPNAQFNTQVANCCKGGVLSSMTQDDSRYGAAFEMSVGIFSPNNTFVVPKNISVGLGGYTCSEPFQVPPTTFKNTGSQHSTQALDTWNVTCSYSEFRASQTPTCCVSLSAFYNDTIVPCPRCSCGCQGLPGSKCSKFGEEPNLLRLPPHHGDELHPIVKCSTHMCPIRVHWHVKVNYREYWRVKMTVTNLNMLKNYSDWNLVVVHPNLKRVTQVYSFNYKPLNQYGYINDTGVFYGIEYYNQMLLQYGNSGNVQTEMLLKKEPGGFTFREGWAFPRKISFNGHDCVMPPPDEYPRLPKSANSGTSPRFHSLVHSLLFLVTIVFKDVLL